LKFFGAICISFYDKLIISIVQLLFVLIHTLQISHINFLNCVYIIYDMFINIHTLQISHINHHQILHYFFGACLIGDDYYYTLDYLYEMTKKNSLYMLWF
jgi:hypothetical protein